MKKLYFVNEPLVSPKSKTYINECIDTGWLSSEGKFVTKFENSMAKLFNRKYGIAVSSGTAALDIAIKSLNLKKNEEVILPNLTIISCLNEILRSGAKPIFVDVESDTYNINPDLIENKISKNTKAIMVVNLYGLPVRFNKILKIAKKYKLKLIEDNAEQIGQYYKNSPCGSFGDISTTSFYANKHITTGEGGMIFTNNKKIDQKCRMLRNLNFQKNKRFVHNDVGWNYRMTNIQAAVGLAQLESLDKYIRIKRKIGYWYNIYLKNLNSIKLPIIKTDYAENIFWVNTIVISKKYKLTAKKLAEELKKQGVETRNFFYPLNKQPLLKNYKLNNYDNFPISNYLFKKGLYLPSGMNLKKNDVKEISNILKKTLDSLIKF